MNVNHQGIVTYKTQKTPFSHIGQTRRYAPTTGLNGNWFGREGWGGDNAIKLSEGEHAGSPLQSLNTLCFVGADLRVCP